MKKPIRKKLFNYKTPIHIFFILYSLLCIIPFWIIISISLSTEADIVSEGFAMFPKHLTFEAYEYIFGDASALWRSYAVTSLYAIIGTVIGVAVMAMFGYSLSRDNYVFKKPLVYYTLFTMLFYHFLKLGVVDSAVVLRLANTKHIKIWSVKNVKLHFKKSP